MVCMVFLIPLQYNMKGLCLSLRDEETKNNVYRIEEVSVIVYLKWIRESSFHGALRLFNMVKERCMRV